MPPWVLPRLTEPDHEATIPPRLAQVLVGICQGHSNAQIGQRLHIAEDTVKSHVRRLLARTGADNRTHLAALVASGQVHVNVERHTRKAP